MDRSIFLSKALGIYLVIVSIAILINMPAFIAQMNNLIHTPSLLFITGFFTLILGILMVLSHNIWEMNYRVLITIISWLTLLKGILLIFQPTMIDTLSMLFVQNSTFAYTAAFIDLALGICFCYFGFRR